MSLYWLTPTRTAFTLLPETIRYGSPPPETSSTSWVSLGLASAIPIDFILLILLSLMCMLTLTLIFVKDCPCNNLRGLRRQGCLCHQAHPLNLPRQPCGTG